jgi:hypothetical protein
LLWFTWKSYILVYSSNYEVDLIQLGLLLLNAGSYKIITGNKVST